MEKRKNFIKIFGTIILTAAMLVTGAICTQPLQVEADETSSVTLTKTTGLTWKIGSTATASWNAVDGANNYVVKVTVSDGSKILGTTTTETADTEVDLQQEIRTVCTDSKSSATTVFVTYNITAALRSEEGDVTSATSEESASWIYVLSGTYNTQLPTPTNVQLSSDLVASWTMPMYSNCVYYYRIDYTIGKTTGSTEYYCTNAERASVTDYSMDISAMVMATEDTVDDKDLSTNAALYGTTDPRMAVTCKVTAVAKSEYSYSGINFSNSVAGATKGGVYVAKKTVLPQNITLSDDYKVSWTAPDITKDITYRVTCKLTDGTKKWTYSAGNYASSSACYLSGTTYTIDLKSTFNQMYTSCGIAGSSLKATVYVIPYLKNSNHSFGTYGCNCPYDYSDESNAVDFELDTYTFQAPTDLALDENLVATWTNVEHSDLAQYYTISYCVLSEDGQETLVSSSAVCNCSSGTKPGTANSMDLNSIITKSMVSNGLLSGKYQIRARISTDVVSAGKKIQNYVIYTSSSVSDYTPDVTIQAVGAEVTLSAGMTATWDAIDGQNSAYYYYMVYFMTGSSKKTQTAFRGLNVRDTKDTYSYDLKRSIQDSLINNSLTNQAVKIKVAAVTYVPATEEDAAQLVYSNEISYKLTQTAMATPASASVVGNMKMSWTPVTAANSFSDMRYRVLMTFTDKAGKKSTYTADLNYSPTATANIVDGKYTVDLYNTVYAEFKSIGYIVGDVCKVSFQVQVYALTRIIVDDVYYVSGSYSAAITREFDGRKTVEAITLSPRQPIVSEYGSVALGKTIEPEDAFYSSITWTSSNSGIAKTNKIGRISGVQPGTVNITASVGSGKDTVPIKVYQVITNAELAANQKVIQKTVGEIVDSICNDEDPDVSKTSIDKKNIAELAEEIRDCVLNGGEVHADLFVTKLSEEDYKNRTDRVDLTSVMTGDSYIYVDGYEAEIVMYYVGLDGEKHYFGYLYETDTPISITEEYTPLSTDQTTVPAGYYETYEGIYALEANGVSPYKCSYNHIRTVRLAVSGSWADGENLQVKFGDNQMAAVRNGNYIDVTVPKNFYPDEEFDIQISNDGCSWVHFGTYTSLFATGENISVSPDGSTLTLEQTALTRKSTTDKTTKAKTYTYTIKTSRLGDFAMVYEQVPIVPTFSKISPATSANKYAVKVKLTASSSWAPQKDFALYFNKQKMTTEVDAKGNITITVPADYEPDTYSIQIHNAGKDYDLSNTYTSVKYVAPIPTFTRLTPAEGTNNVARTVTLVKTTTWECDTDFAVYFGDTKMTTTVQGTSIKVTVPKNFSAGTYKIKVVNEGITTETELTYTSKKYVPPTPVFKKITPTEGVNNVARTVVMTKDTSWDVADDFAVYFGNTKMTTVVKGTTIKVTVPANFADGVYEIKVVNEGVTTEIGDSYISKQYVAPAPKFKSQSLTSGINNKSYKIKFLMDTQNGWSIASDFAVYLNSEAVTAKKQGDYIVVTIPKGLATGDYTLYILNNKVKTKMGTWTSEAYIPPTPKFKSQKVTSGYNNVAHKIKIQKDQSNGWVLADNFTVYLGSEKVASKDSGKYISLTIPKNCTAGSYTIYIENNGSRTKMGTWESIQYIPKTTIVKDISVTSAAKNKKVKTIITFDITDGWKAMNDFMVYMGSEKCTIGSRRYNYKKNEMRATITTPKLETGSYTIKVLNDEVTTSVGHFTVR